MTERLVRRSRPAHPRDAASLVVLKGSRTNPSVLLGRRRQDAKFVPGVYVFPGGRLDRADYRHGNAYRARADVLAKLRRHCRHERKASALIWTAIRETWEETGLLIGQPGHINGAKHSELHEAYHDAGFKPDLQRISYVARAITPARSPIRFNTRFFLAHGSDTVGELHSSSELVDIGWKPVKEAIHELDLMGVTKFALRHALAYWRESPDPDPNRKVPRLIRHQEPQTFRLE